MLLQNDNYELENGTAYTQGTADQDNPSILYYDSINKTNKIDKTKFINNRSIDIINKFTKNESEIGKLLLKLKTVRNLRKKPVPRHFWNSESESSRSLFGKLDLDDMIRRLKSSSQSAIVRRKPSNLDDYEYNANYLPDNLNEGLVNLKEASHQILNFEMNKRVNGTKEIRRSSDEVAKDITYNYPTGDNFHANVNSMEFPFSVSTGFTNGLGPRETIQNKSEPIYFLENSDVPPAIKMQALDDINGINREVAGRVSKEKTKVFFSNSINDDRVSNSNSPKVYPGDTSLDTTAVQNSLPDDVNDDVRSRDKNKLSSILKNKNGTSSNDKVLHSSLPINTKVKELQKDVKYDRFYDKSGIDFTDYAFLEHISLKCNGLHLN